MYFYEKTLNNFYIVTTPNGEHCAFFYSFTGEDINYATFSSSEKMHSAVHKFLEKQNYKSLNESDGMAVGVFSFFDDNKIDIVNVNRSKKIQITLKKGEKGLQNLKIVDLGAPLGIKICGKI